MRRGIERTIMTAALTLAGTLAATLSPVAANAAPLLLPIPVIPCGDTAALINQMTIFNQISAPTHIYLSKNCTYKVTTINHADATGDNGLPPVTGNLSIVGQGSTIARVGNGRFRLFHVPVGGALTLNDVTVLNGAAPASTGGAINDFGKVTLTNTDLTGNAATLGGALYVAHGASAVITGGNFTANHGTDLGGAITNTGTLVITNAKLYGNASVNQGGAIDNNSNGLLTLNNTTIEHNLAGSGGGAISNIGGGTVTINAGSIIDNNTETGAGGIYEAGGTVNILNAPSISDNTPTDCIGSPVFIPNCVH